MDGINKIRYQNTFQDESIIVAYIRRFRRKILEHGICLKARTEGEILDRFMTKEEQERVDSFNYSAFLITRDDKETEVAIKYINLLIDRVEFIGIDRFSKIYFTTEIVEIENKPGVYPFREFSLKEFIDGNVFTNNLRFRVNADTYLTALEKLKAKRRMKSLDRVLNRHAIEDVEELEEFKI